MAAFGEEDESAETDKLLVNRKNRQQPQCCGVDVALYNVVLLGISFMLVFTAFQTTGMVEASVIKSAKNEASKEHIPFHVSGYYSLAIIYAVFALFNWFAPSVVNICGPRLSMVLGGITYIIFIATLMLNVKLLNYFLYITSALIGIGAAVIWTAQGNYLTLNSNVDTIARNSGIFWALLQCSFLFGNLYVYFAFEGKTDDIDSSTRKTLFTVLGVVCGIGTLSFCLLLKPPTPDDSTINENEPEADDPSRGESRKPGPVEVLVQSFKLFFTKNMLLLSFCFAYTGLELTFFSSVFITCIGNTSRFESAKRQMGLAGIFVGVGEILGGACFGIFGKRTNVYGREPIVFMGLVVHFICFFLIFLNFAVDAPFQDTNDVGYFSPPILWMAILCAFMLGLGDSSFNTQIFSILGSMYQKESAPAFALFKFVQSMFAAIGFFYSSYLELHWQLLVLVLMGMIGTMTFFKVEWEAQRILKQSRRDIVE